MPAPGSSSSPAAPGPATEEALRRSEERYRALVQGGAQIVWVASPDGEMLEDSAEWRWITGQTVEEFLGNGWLDSIHPEDRERVERDWRECLRTGRIFDDRFRMRARGGAYRHYDVRAVPIERDGKIAEWVGACTDVTSQREAEEMRGRLTDQLSAAALRTARLQQATAMLAEALDVEQVVEVITEVGRTAIGALRSAVALLDDDKLGLRVVNRSGLAPTGPDGAGVRLTLDTPSVMTRAIATRRPVLIADPEELSSQFDNDPAADGRPGRVARHRRRAGLGRPAAARGGHAARRAAVLLRQAADDPRRGARLPRGARRAVRARRGAGRDVREGAHRRGHPAAEPAARRAAERARPRARRQVPAAGPRTWAATGTTYSGCPTGGWPSRSATSWARGCWRRPAWGGCATRCARWR